MSTSVADLFVVLDSVTDPFSSGLKKASADAESESKKMSGALGAVAKIGLGLGVATIGIGVASVKAASEFQASMTKLYTAAGAPKAAIQGATGAVLQLGTQVGMTGTQIAEALYHPISAGLDLATSLQVVKYAAEETAISGANLDDTTYSLSSVMKSFNEPASQAAQTMADLNAVVGDGDMRFQDFNESIKNWAPTAAQMGLSVDSMGAGLAYLTDRGNSAEVASTRLTMGISMLTTPTKQAAALLEGMGVASSDVTASSKAMTDILQATGITQNQLAADLKKPDGLYVALNQLQTALDKAGIHGTEADSVLSKLFGGGRSDKAVTALMSNLDGLKQKYDQITTDSTVTKFESNWEGAKSTFSFQVHQMETAIENWGIGLGTKILPMLSTFITNAEGVLGPWFDTVTKDFGQFESGLAAPPAPTSQTNLGGTHYRSPDLSGAQITPQLTEMQKLGQLAREVGGDLSRFGDDTYQAFRTILTVAKPLAESFKNDLADGFKIAGGLLSNVVGPAFKDFADFLSEHQGAVKFFADVVLGGLIAKMTILGTLSAAKSIVGLATAVISFPFNQANAIGTAFGELKTAVVGTEMQEGEQAVAGLSGAFGNLKNAATGVLDKFPLFDSGKLASLAYAGQSLGTVEEEVGGIEKAAGGQQLSLFETNMNGVVQAADHEQLSLFETDLAGISAEAGQGPAHLAQLEGSLTGMGGAASDAEEGMGSLMGKLGKFAMGAGIIGAAVGGITMLGQELGKLSGVGLQMGTSMDQLNAYLQLAAQGSASARQSFAEQAYALITVNNLTHKGGEELQQLDADMASLVTSGHMDDAKAEFQAIAAMLEKQGISAKQAATYFPAYEDAVTNAGNAAQTMDGKVQDLMGTLNQQQSLTQFNMDLQNVTQSIQTNGHALLGNSQAASANQMAFQQAATDVANYYQQQRNANVPISTATADMQKQVVQLEQVGIKAGLTKKQVDAYLTSLGLIKPSYSTTIKVNTSGLDSALSTTQQLIRALGNVPSGSIPVIGSRAVSARAGGGPVTANNTYLVGESGPEIVTFGASGYVTPNAMLKPAVLSGTGGLGAMSGGGTVVYQYIVNVAGSVLTEKRLVDVVRTQVLQYNGRNSGNGLSLTR